MKIFIGSTFMAVPLAAGNFCLKFASYVKYTSMMKNTACMIVSRRVKKCSPCKLKAIVTMRVYAISIIKWNRACKYISKHNKEFAGNVNSISGKSWNGRQD